MNSMHYIGFDIHKKVISFCEKLMDSTIVDQGTIRATRESITNWAEGRTAEWIGAMEATIFTGWIYDYLLPYALELKVAHPAMLKAITAAKKKNDAADSEMIVDLLRCNLLPECYMAPEEHRNLRRILRYRNFLVREAAKMKIKTSGLLMEVGVEYNKKRLHGARYFQELLGKLDYVPESVLQLLQMSRSSMESFDKMQKSLISGLREDPQISHRVELLMSIPGVGEVTALTWVLEMGEIDRFARINQAVSYCGLCSAQKQSAGKDYRGPISKQRNKHLQTVLIEAAKLAPRWNQQLAEVHEREITKGNRNRATLAVARKLVAYLMAVDKNQKKFSPKEVLQEAA
ncbi:MAG TPA: IS110 family transposase [Desulfobulbaceae bacterium]|nr:IS110 family transposase [Desulfobulbaceae bacterium]